MSKMHQHQVPDLCSEDLTPAFFASQVVLLLAADHTAFDDAAIIKRGKLIVDTRNTTKNVEAVRVKQNTESEVQYYQIKQL